MKDIEQLPTISLEQLDHVTGGFWQWLAPFLFNPTVNYGKVKGNNNRQNVGGTQTRGDGGGEGQ